MFRNYLKIAFRRLLKNPVYSAINIIGLTLGLLSFVLISLYVLDELSYDRFWSESEQLYRLETTINKAGSGKEVSYPRTYPPLLPILQSNFPEISDNSRLIKMEFVAAVQQNKYFQDVNFVDSSFLDVFGVNFVEGTLHEALKTPFSVVLTQSQAKRYFPGKSALNQVVSLDGKHQMSVTGIIEDLPRNTHLPEGMFASIESLKTMYNEGILLHWQFPTMHAYVKLAPKLDVNQLSDAINQLIPTLAPQQLRDTITLSLTPIKSIRAQENKIGNFDAIALITTLSALVLLMACINNINLATARGQERGKEAGLRKSIGASRSQLFSQFLTESFLTVIIATLLTLLFATILLPWFAAVTNKTLMWADFISVGNLINLVLLIIFTGLLSGLYPAVVMSNFKPVDIFKGNQGYGQGSFSIRKVLVVLQFAIAITLSIGTVVFYQQMNHIKNTDLGFEDENMIILQNMGWTDIRPNYGTLKNALQQHGNIHSVAGSISVPGKEFDRVALFHAEGQDPSTAVRLHRMAADLNFLDTYGVRLLGGRLFSEEFAADEIIPNDDESVRSVFNAVLNESALKSFGWSTPSDGLGKIVYSSDDKWPFDVKVVGIVEDFHLLAGHGTINPYIFVVSKGAVQYASIKISGNGVTDTLAYIDETWSRINPNYPIVRSFLRADLDSAFASWERNVQMMFSLSVLAIAIAIIGSVGMASYSAKSKTKEIGIRKVVGATTFDLIHLLVWDLTKPLIFANLLALPIAYLLMTNWLSGFAYRVDLSIGVFVIALISSIFVCWSTVSFHAYKISATSPAKTFKHI